MTQLENDNKIIADNPGKEPYELVHLGLSDEAYQRLTKEQDKKQKPAKAEKKATAKKADPAPEVPEETVQETVQEQQQKAIPTIVVQQEGRTVIAAAPKTDIPATFHRTDGVALVRDERTGQTSKLNRAVAQRMAQKRPHIKIIG